MHSGKQYGHQPARKRQGWESQLGSRESRCLQQRPLRRVWPLSSLSWEMLPDAALGEADVWAKLIDNGLPQTALLRQLPRLTRLGLLAPMSDTLDTVVGRLADADRLRKARVHR